jgi:hypothetical protein
LNLAVVYWHKTHQILTKYKSQFTSSGKQKIIHYKCVHHKKPEKIKSKSTGIRPLQNYNAKGCPAEYQIYYVEQKQNYGKYQIRKWNPEHNHELNETDYKLHFKNRKL